VCARAPAAARGCSDDDAVNLLLVRTMHIILLYIVELHFVTETSADDDFVGHNDGFLTPPLGHVRLVVDRDRIT